MILQAHIPPPPAEDLARTPPSVLAWFEARIAVLEARIRELEAKIGMNSSNSNSPPSSDSPFNKPTTKASGKKRTQRRGVRQQFLEPTEVIVCAPKQCVCGCQSTASVEEYYRHQFIEMPQPTLEVTHFSLQRGQCIQCGKTVKAHIPQEFRLGYGNRIHALIAHLLGPRGMSRQHVQAFLLEVYGLPISAGGIQKCFDRTSKSLLPHYAAIQDIARSAPVSYIDETSWRRIGPQGAKLLWLWVMASATVAFFMIHAKRSMSAFEALIANWKGILVSDGYGVYQKWDGVARQSCLAHLIRAAKALKEDTRREIAASGSWAHRELKRLCRMSRIRPRFCDIDALHARLCRFVQIYSGRKDRAGTFARRIKRELPHLKVFLEHKGVDPTNNHAERCLRPAVIRRKVNYGTGNDKGDRSMERFLSVSLTCRMRKKPIFPLFVTIMQAYAKGTQQDTSWLVA